MLKRSEKVESEIENEINIENNLAKGIPIETTKFNLLSKIADNLEIY